MTHLVVAETIEWRQKGRKQSLILDILDGIFVFVWRGGRVGTRNRCYHCSHLYLAVPFQGHVDKLPVKMEKEGFNEVLIEPLKQFAKDSIHLVKKCTKPDRKEFTNIAKATGVGFLIMGFIGFFVKLIHIPINNILVGQ